MEIRHLSVYASLHEDLLDHEVAELGEAEDLLEHLDVAVGAPQPRKRELDLPQRLRHAHEVTLGIPAAVVVVFARLEGEIQVEFAMGSFI